MKFLFLVSYYHPHLSGLTISARNRAEGLASRGHTVTVIAAKQRDDLPSEETVGGVRVIRLPVRIRIHKGVVMQGYSDRVKRELESHDALVQYLPATPIEAWASARAARSLGKPLIVDYVCDIRLPGRWKDRAVERLAMAGHRMAARAASAILFSTEDYASTSPFANAFESKVRIVPLPISVPVPDTEAASAWKSSLATHGEKLIGFAGRMAAEKGLEVLLDAVQRLIRGGRKVRLLLAGEVANVIGEESYRRRILAATKDLGSHCLLLGTIQPDLSAFYCVCDVLVLPSLNRTESFGMVQVEAMLCGTPVVASNLPGVRVPVQRTGMGRIVAPGDAAALADAIADILKEPGRYRADEDSVREEFSISRSLDTFENVAREFV